MKRPFASKRPIGPVLVYEQSRGIDEGDRRFIEDIEEFMDAIRNTVENHPHPNVKVLRETQESVDIRIDAVDKQKFIRATE